MAPTACSVLRTRHLTEDGGADFLGGGAIGGPQPTPPIDFMGGGGGMSSMGMGAAPLQLDADAWTMDEPSSALPE